MLAAQRARKWPSWCRWGGLWGPRWPGRTKPHSRPSAPSTRRRRTSSCRQPQSPAMVLRSSRGPGAPGICSCVPRPGPLGGFPRGGAAVMAFAPRAGSGPSGLSPDALRQGLAIHGGPFAEAVAAVAHRVAQGEVRPAGGSGKEGRGRRAASDRHAPGAPGVDAVIAVSASSGAYGLLLATDGGVKECGPRTSRYRRNKDGRLAAALRSSTPFWGKPSTLVSQSPSENFPPRWVP
jgi:hypothetical protein